MLLQSINRVYIYIGITLFLVFTAFIINKTDFVWMHIASFISFIIYSITIYKSTLMNETFFVKRNVAFIVLLIALVETAIWGLLSYTIDGDIFLFSKKDGLIYYTIGMKVRSMPFVGIIHYVMNVLGYGLDDLGMFIWVSTIFKIIPSLAFLYFCNCIISMISALLIFNIGRHLMPRRYAFIAALSFSLSSFITVFHAVCLKETVFIACIIASFNYFMMYMRKREGRYLWLTLLFSLLILFFRTPTALLLICAFGITYVLLYTKGPIAIVLIIIFSLILSSTSLFSYVYDRYLRGGNTELIIERKNELAGEGGIINQLADPVASLAGPFPSINIKSVAKTPLYASGLLYRFLLSAPFFLGTYFIFKERYIKMYPFAIFFLINAIGVAISVKGLEVRLSMPHLAMMYIVAFWFLAKYDYGQIRWKISSQLLYYYFIGILGLCLLWNLR